MKKISYIYFFIVFFVLQNYIYSQGNSCSTATSLTVNGMCGAGTVSNNILSLPAPLCNPGGYSANREGWYKFTATQTHHTITGISSSGGLCIQVFSLSGACPAGLTEIGCSNAVTGIATQTESCGFTSGLTIGTTYYIRVVGFQNANVVLTSLCISDAVTSYAIPTCMSDNIVVLTGNVISVYDPSQPITGTNPVQTIPMPYSTFDGLTLSPNLNGGPTSPTYYTVNSTTGNFMWWNASTLQWVNTGHTNGTPNAINLAAGGGYIYALECATGNVYRYNGTGNATLFATVPNVGVCDLVADVNGNFYIASNSSSSLNTYSALNGSLLCTIGLSFPVPPNGGAGFSVIGNNIYVGVNSGTGYLTGVMSGTNTINLTANTNPFAGLSSDDWATCEFGGFGVLNISPSITICPSESATLTATGGTSYTWSPAVSLNTNVGSTVIATPSTTTIYTVSSSGNGCFAGVQTQTVQVSVTNNLPVIGQITGTSSICANQSNVTYSVINLPNTNYTWTIPAGASIISTPTNSNSITVNYGINAGVITIQASNSCGVTTETLNVVLNPNLTLSVTPTTPTICSGGTVNLTVTGATTYIWSNSLTLNTSGGSTVAASPSVTTIYTVTGMTGTCFGATTATVFVGSNLTLTLTPTSTVICPTNTVNINVSGANTYTWNNTNTLNGSNVVASPSITTVYTVSGTDNTGCYGTGTVSIVVDISNNLITSPNVTICPGASSNINASGEISYTWTPAISLSSTIGATVTASPNVTTIYTVSSTSNIGCLHTATVLVSIENVPNILISSTSSSICSGNSSSLTATGLLNNLYTWTPAATLSSGTGSVVVANPANTTTYTIVGNTGSLNNCIDTATYILNVVPIISAKIDTVKPICLGETTTIIAHGGNTYQWSPINDFSHATDSICVVNPTSNITYTVMVSTNGICPQTVNVQVIVNPLPIVNAGNDTIINVLDGIMLQGSGNVDVGFVTPLNQLNNCNFCNKILVYPQENTCFVLAGYTNYGCKNTDEICVTVVKDWSVFIPNSFTANGDDVNDYFMPKGYGIEQIDLMIFDRWGAQIFNEENTVLGWNGKYKGKYCQQDTYIYVVNIKAINGTSSKKTGHVTLLTPSN